jgi:Tetracyclin repressor-like, C-terminal domain
VVIRGNSAPGKTTVAARIRAKRAAQDLAIVSQDGLRRDVLRGRDVSGGANIRLIELATRHATASGFHVIVEGIQRTTTANLVLSMLTSLYRWYDPTGPTTPQQLEAQIAAVLGALMPP